MTERVKQSQLLSQVLDALGCRYNLVKQRQKYYDEVNQVLTEENRCFIAGSKSEGLTNLYESDIDYVQVCGDIVCVEPRTSDEHTISDEHTTPHNAAVFYMDRSDTPPGYTYLILKNGEDVNLPESFNKYLSVTPTGQLLLSSQKFISDTKNAALERNELGDAVITQSGPAVTNKHVINGNIQTLSVSFDQVQAVRCQCPSILQAWINRPRQHEWPVDATVAEIALLDAHVVSIGQKGSPTSDNEWRICFTKAENKLVKTFNDTQVKLYALLRIVAKHFLKPVCSDFTSYVMKNVVFWMCETKPATCFHDDALMDLYIESLQLLAQFVNDGSVPNYMIPDRNLLVNCLHPGNAQQVSITLQHCIQSGWQVFGQIDSLRDMLAAVASNPTMVLQNQTSKAMSEMLCMEKSLLLWKKEEVVQSLERKDSSKNRSIQSILNVLYKEVGLKEIMELVQSSLRGTLVRLQRELKELIKRLKDMEHLYDETEFKCCFVCNNHFAMRVSAYTA